MCVEPPPSDRELSARATIRYAPEYDPGQPLSREYEERLRRYFGPPKYWEPCP